MESRAGGLWQRQIDSPLGNPPKHGEYFFHRDGDEIADPCTLCLSRKKPGHLYVPVITPDDFGVIPHEQVVAIIRDFDAQIANLAAEAVDGITSIGADKHTLEDHFSSDSIALLERFCKTSNDLGSHALDKQKWVAFLLHVFRNQNERVPGDVFRELLLAKHWWPESDIRRLGREYDFAMALLSQAEED
jgi:hypothetical protein